MQIVRPKMTQPTYMALKKYILKDREKKKQEQEQDKEQERLKKEREMKRKKEEEDNLTLEQTKEQIHQLEEKLASLKQEKSNLFSQLKKVLYQENDLRQRTQQREQTEQATLQHQYLSGLNVHPQVILQQQQQQLQQRQKYLNIPAHNASPSRHTTKRSRSPSPTLPTYPLPFNSQFLPPNPVYNKNHEALRLKPGSYPPPPSQTQPPPTHPGLFLTQQQQQQHNFLLQQQQQQQQQNYSSSMNVQKYHPSISPVNIYFSQQQQQQQQQQHQQQQQQLGYSPHQQQQPLKQQATNFIKSPSNSRSKQATPYGFQSQPASHPEHPSKQMYSSDDKIKSNQVLPVGGGMLQVSGIKGGSIVTGHPATLHQQQQLLQQQQQMQQQQLQLSNTFNASPSAVHNQPRPHNYAAPPQGRY